MRGPECKCSCASSPRWSPFWKRAGHGLIAAARTLLAVSALVILCGCCAAGSSVRAAAGSSGLPPSLRPLTLDGTEGAWMDWRDAGTLDAWLESVGATP